MGIVIICENTNLEPWISALQKEDPSVPVKLHGEVDDRSKVAFILAWSYPKGFLKEFSGLRTVSSMGAGVDHLVDDTELPASVNIVRIVDPLLSQDMFEFVLAVIMNRLRMLTLFREYQSKGLWKRKRYRRISETRVGILGTGEIGHHIATQLHDTGFRVYGWGRTEGRPARYRKFHGNQQLDQLLSISDILVNLLPLTNETQGILNFENLSKLPENAWLINIGRGGHLVEDDLLKLLDSGYLAGASLDVFNQEPLPPDHPFWNHPGIHITPHLASLPDPSSVAPQIIENYRRTIENRPLLNMVDRERGY